MQKVLMITAAGLGVALSLTSVAMAGNAKDGEPSKPGGKTVAVATTPAPPPQPKVYQVQSGDNLSSIAQTEQLDSWHPLWNANPALPDPNVIYPGQFLAVPTGPTTDRPVPAGMATPAPAPVSYSAPVHYQSYRNNPAASYAAGAGGLLARIRARESGGNYADNTGNGYFGAYQFSLGTWRGVGGSGLPSDASPAEQDMRAQMLYNERGCSPWPNTCY